MKTVYQGMNSPYILYACILARAKAAAARFVKFDIDNKTPLGVVTFSTYATTVLFSITRRSRSDVEDEIYLVIKVIKL